MCVYSTQACVHTWPLAYPQGLQIQPQKGYSHLFSLQTEKQHLYEGSGTLCPCLSESLNPSSPLSPSLPLPTSLECAFAEEPIRADYEHAA